MNASLKTRLSGAFTCLFCALCFSLDAQIQNCGLPAGAGGNIGVSPGIVAPGTLSPDPSFTGESSGLDLVEFLFINPNNLITDEFTSTTGPEIIGANSTGRIDPDELGLNVGDEFCVMSLSFSLSVLQDQIDTLFAGEFLGLTCCEFAEFIQDTAVCMLLIDAGVNEGADITNAQEIVDFGVNYGISATLESLFILIDSVINIVPPTAGCVTGQQMCYATSNRVCFTVDTTGGTTSVNPVLDGTNWINKLEAGPNPATDSWIMNFETEWTGEAEVLVSDLSGRTAYRGLAEIQSGTNRVPVDFSSMASGQYVITLQTADWAIRTRAVRQ